MASDEDAQAKRLILILGGARSGKSSYAESLATQMAGARSVLYVATATAEDDDMRARIGAHRAARPASWTTLEAPRDPAAALLAHDAVAPHAAETARGVAIVDCITLLVSNLLLGGPDATVDPEQMDAASVDAAESRVQQATTRLLDVYRAGSRSLLLVSNEVGMGVVPPYALGRIYRDLLGRVNARLAAEADHVVLMLAGLPIEVKALADAWRTQAQQFTKRDIPS